MEIEIIVAAVLLLIVVFLATIDGAFSHISDVGLRRISSDDENSGSSSIEFLREILDNRPRFRFAISSSIQVFLIAFTVLLTVIVSAYTTSRVELLAFALLFGLVGTFVLRQIVPRVIVRKNPEQKLLILLPAIRPVYRFVSILVGPFAPDKNAKLRGIDVTAAPNTEDDKEDDSDEDFHALMEVGEAEGIIEEKERELIETMVEFSDTRVGEIMTPRTEICGIPAESTVREARDLIIAEKYSRLPVYRDSIDNIEGVIYVRDLLQAWADGLEQMSVSNILRDAYFVPETKPASELLRSMQLNHIQIAIVIDEYGGIAGLVTVEDLIEEIVGEIEDEDAGRDEIIEIIEGEDGYFDVLGSTEIDKIERLFDDDIELEDDEYTTIAGLVTSDLGYVPKEGDEFTLHGLDVKILKADDKRINLIRLRKALPDETGDPDASAEE